MAFRTAVLPGVESVPRRSLVTQAGKQKPARGDEEGIENSIGRREPHTSTANLPLGDGAPAMLQKNDCQKTRGHQTESEPLENMGHVTESHLSQPGCRTGKDTAAEPASGLFQPDSGTDDTAAKPASGLSQPGSRTENDTAAEQASGLFQPDSRTDDTAADPASDLSNPGSRTAIEDASAPAAVLFQPGSRTDIEDASAPASDLSQSGSRTDIEAASAPASDLSQLGSRPGNDTAGDPASGLSQPVSRTGTEAGAGAASSESARSRDQVDPRELGLCHLTNDRGKGKGCSKSSCRKETQTEAHALRRLFLFFRRRASGGCNEVKQPEDANCLASVVKAVNEDTHPALDTKPDVGSEPGKERKCHCFRLKTLPCLKRKSRGRMQATEVKTVKESKGTTSTGWRRDLSDVRSKEGNLKTPSSRKPSASLDSATDTKGQAQRGTRGQAGHQSSPQKKMGPYENPSLTPTTEQQHLQLAQPPPTKKDAVCKEAALKSRKHLKMKPWRTVPYLTRSEPQSELNTEGEPEVPALNVSTTPEYSQGVERRSEASRPYSKVSFFKRIRQYNRLRKTAGGLNVNPDCESIFENKHAFQDVTAEDITAAEVASESMVSQEDASSAQVAGPTSQDDVVAAEVAGSTISQEDVSIVDNIIYPENITATEIVGPMLSQEEVSAAGVTISVVTQEDVTAAEIAVPTASQEAVTAAKVAGPMARQWDVTAAKVADPMAPQGDVTVEKVADPMAPQESVTAAKVAGPMAPQGDITAAKVAGPMAPQGGVTAAKVAGTLAPQGDVTTAKGAGPMALQGDVTAAKVAGTMAPHEDVTAAKVAGTLAPQGDVTAAKVAGTMASQGGVIVAKVEGTMAPQGDVTAAKVAGTMAPQGDVTAAKVAGTVAPQGDVTAAKVAGTMTPQGDVTVAELPGCTVTQEAVAAAMFADTTVCSKNITSAGATGPRVSEVEGVNGTQPGSETPEDYQPTSAKKRLSTRDQAQISATQNFTQDLKQVSVETKREEESEVRMSCGDMEVSDSITGALHSVETLVGVCDTAGLEQNEMLPAASALAMFNKSLDVKYPLVAVHARDSGDQDKPGRLMNRETSVMGQTAEGVGEQADQTTKDYSQKELVQKGTDSSKSNGQTADQPVEDKSVTFMEKLQELQHLEKAVLTEEGEGIPAQKVTVPLAGPAFQGENVWTNPNGWGVSVLSGLHPSSQDTGDTQLAQGLAMCKTKPPEPSLECATSAGTHRDGPTQRNPKGSLQFDPTCEKDMMNEIGERDSWPDSDKQQTEAHDNSPPSPTSYPSYQTHQEEDDLFEGSFTGMSFSRSMDEDWSPSQITMAVTATPSVWDATGQEIHPRTGRALHKAGRQTRLTEMSSVGMHLDEREKRMLYEAAVGIVEAAVQAAAGHIAQGQQEQEWGLQASSPGAGGSLCLQIPVTTGKRVQPQKCKHPESA